MFVSRPFVIVWLFLCASALFAQTKPAVPTEDNQVWSDLQILYALDSKVDVFTNAAFRLGRNITHPVDERIGSGFIYKPSKFLTISPAFLYLAQQPLKNIKRYENRVNLAITLIYPSKKYTVSDRNQFEKRFLSNRPDTWRYRNRLQVERNVNVKKFKFSVYVSDEVFYDSGAKAWTRNRFLAGITHKFSPRYAIDFYGGRQNDGRTRRGNWNIIGTALKIRLK